jgi:signal transduction histidine kinase
MHWVSAVLVISQLIFVVLRFVSVGHFVSARPDDTERLLAFVFYLLLVLYLLWIVGNRFNQMHVQRLGFEYSKLQLIETLSQSQDQLHIERQALVAANKLVQQFYSGAAHDLRQPVYAMQLYTTMLADDPTQSKVLLPKITQSCAAINDMFNTLFDYQQTHMNDTELVEKDINIQEAFQSLALHFQPIASNKGLQIRFKPIPGSITIVPLYFVRILSNLIANALRYTNTGGVLIAARKTRTHIRFQVWDTGIGMDDATVRNIFDEFYKANSSETVNDGLGLGLSIAKQLSSRIDHANISVKSRAARGSVFKFSIPIARYKLEML